MEPAHSDTGDCRVEPPASILVARLSMSHLVPLLEFNLMDRAVRDCLVTRHEALIPALTLPDPDDRHILAAAIAGRCDVIVTQNLRDFPAEALAPYGLEAQHPDDFLSNQLNLAPGLFCEVIRKVRARLKNPPFTAEQYLGVLTQNGLVATASDLTQFSSLI